MAYNSSIGTCYNAVSFYLDLFFRFIIAKRMPVSTSAILMPPDAVAAIMNFYSSFLI